MKKKRTLTTCFSPKFTSQLQDLAFNIMNLGGACLVLLFSFFGWHRKDMLKASNPYTMPAAIWWANLQYKHTHKKRFLANKEDPILNSRTTVFRIWCNTAPLDVNDSLAIFYFLSHLISCNGFLFWL